MQVRECYFDAATGERGERWVEMPGVITEAEAVEMDRLAEIATHNDGIRAQLAANDVSVIRAIVEGDSGRIAAHAAAQAALRVQLL